MMSTPWPEPTMVRQLVTIALKLLYERDAYLMDVDAHERSISHKLAMYLEIEGPKYIGAGWHVDCEYNRDGHAPKTVHLPTLRTVGDYEEVSVYPDIIVHVRGKDGGQDGNLLAIEIKKSTGRNADEDMQKLCCFRQQLRYKHTLFLRLARTRAEVQECWLADP